LLEKKIAKEERKRKLEREREAKRRAEEAEAKAKVLNDTSLSMNQTKVGFKATQEQRVEDLLRILLQQWSDRVE